MSQVHRITLVTTRGNNNGEVTRIAGTTDATEGSRDLPSLDRLQKLRFQVMRVSFLMMIVIVAIHLSSLFLPRIITRSGPGFTLLLVMWAPWCGYQGSRTLNTSLLHVFIFLNVLTMIWMVATVIFDFPLYLSIIRGENQIMGEDGNETVSIPEEFRDEVRRGYIIYGVLLLALAILQCAAIVLGYLLFNETNRQRLLIVQRNTSAAMGINAVRGQPIDGLDDLLRLIAGNPGEETQRGLPDQKLESFPVTMITENDLQVDDGHNMCVICQDDYEVGTQVRVLPCKHKYHTECISRWLKRSVHCPICNRDLTSGDSDETQIAPTIAVPVQPSQLQISMV